MEMIAMLGGLGRTPGPANRYLPPDVNPYSALYRYKLNGFGAALVDADYDAVVAFLSAAKTNQDFEDVLASINASSKLSEAQKAELRTKVEDARTPFYKKPLYWVGVAAVAWVGYRLYTKQPIIPGLGGLDGRYGQPMYERHTRAVVWVDAVAPDGSTYSKRWTGEGSAKGLITRLRKRFKADGYKHIHIKSWGRT
jgi:hypothetical protein